MTQVRMMDSNGRMGRPPLNVKPTLVRLPEDFPKRIDALVGKQKRAAFIREAVAAELERRESDVRLDRSVGDDA